MTDFLYSSRARAPGVLADCLRAYLAPAGMEVVEVPGSWGGLAVARRPHAPSPVFRDEAGCTVVLGEPIVALPSREPGRLHEDGRREALHRLLLSPGEHPWHEHLDGMWAAFVVDAAGKARVLTDRFSFVPVYQAAHASGGTWITGTHVDAVARAAGRQAWDEVSLADLLIHLTCTFPFTTYEQVSQLGPAAEWQVGPEPAPGRWYWRPTEAARFRTVGEAGEALRESIRRDLRVACGGLDQAGILLSGGEDSRALLGAMPRGVPVQAFTFAGAMNREARAARRAAAAYGAHFALGVRDPAHYEAGMPTVAGMIGSMHLFMDVHGAGMHRLLGLDRLPVVVGGLSADSLLKANYAPADDAGSPPPAPPAAPGVRPELVEAVAERRAAFLGILREIRPETAQEWSVLWPFSQRRHGANVHGNRRLFAAHEAYHCNGALEVAAAAPVPWKRGRRLFVEAMRPFLRRSWYVPHARSRFPYFGAVPNVVLGALLRGGRVVRDLATGDIARRQGGWPKWSEVAGSAAAGEARERYPVEESALAAVFTSPEEIAAAVAAVHPLRQMMALQLAYLSGPRAPGVGDAP